MRLFNTPACPAQTTKSLFIVTIFFACMLFANSANAQAVAKEPQGNTPNLTPLHAQKATAINTSLTVNHAGAHTSGALATPNGQVQAATSASKPSTQVTHSQNAAQAHTNAGTGNK